jgi:hypothetical protein
LLPGLDPNDNFMSKAKKRWIGRRLMFAIPTKLCLLSEFLLIFHFQTFFASFIDYSSDVMCRTSFTAGQKERMIAQYELYRMKTPAPIPAPRKAPTSARPVPRPVPRPAPVPRPVPIVPRVTPTAPRSVPTKTCAKLLARCSAERTCCARRKCRRAKGILGSLFGSRCFFF